MVTTPEDAPAEAPAQGRLARLRGGRSAENGQTPENNPDGSPGQEAKAVSVTDWEQTPEGYVELEVEARDIRRALNFDFHHYATTLSRGDLVRLASPRIEAINEQRAAQSLGEVSLDQAGVEEPAVEPTLAHHGEIIPGEMEDKLLYHLAASSWHEMIPRNNTAEEVARWEKFITVLPEYIQVNLEWYREVLSKKQVLDQDEELQDKVHEMRLERMHTLQAATRFLLADRQMEDIKGRIAGFYRGAGYTNRPLTKAENRSIDRLRSQSLDISERQKTGLQEAKKAGNLDEVTAEIKRLTNIQRRKDFEDGLVLTGQMKGIIDELLPSLVQGQPAMLVGETGGAKTALAEFISKRYFKATPEFISGSGDVNSYQVMGKTGLEQVKSGLTWEDIEKIIGEEDVDLEKLSPEAKAQLRLAGLALVTSAGSTSVTEFIPGPIIRAMERGVPVILDEINAMPPEFLKRLNRIMQLRPGDTLTIQEDSGREIVVRPGFVIIATANEKSKRYKGVEDLSVEFQNRFGANIIRVHYPDNDVPYGEQPTENLMLAVTALSDREGNYASDIGETELLMFVKACHVTQQVFSGNHGEGFKDFASTDQIRDQKPGLAETVLAPRTMVDLLMKVKFSHGQLTLDQVLHSFCEGIKNIEDRKQIVTIIENHGFLKDLASANPDKTRP